MRALVNVQYDNNMMMIWWEEGDRKRQKEREI